MSKRHWFVVADGAQARLFTQRRANSLPDLMVEMKSDDARSPTGELVTHGRGRTFASGGARRSALEPETDPQDHEQDVFAARLAKVIEDGRLKDTFTSLSLIAPPKMMGRLREQLSDQTLDLVIEERVADLTHVPTTEMAERLRDQRPPLPLAMA